MTKLLRLLAFVRTLVGGVPAIAAGFLGVNPLTAIIGKVIAVGVGVLALVLSVNFGIDRIESRAAEAQHNVDLVEEGKRAKVVENAYQDRVDAAMAAYRVKYAADMKLEAADAKANASLKSASKPAPARHTAGRRAAPAQPGAFWQAATVARIK